MHGIRRYPVGILAKLPLITALSTFKQSMMSRVKQDD